MVITKNLTPAEAWWILDLTRKTMGRVTDNLPSVATLVQQEQRQHARGEGEEERRHERGPQDRDRGVHARREACGGLRTEDVEVLDVTRGDAGLSGLQVLHRLPDKFLCGVDEVPVVVCEAHGVEAAERDVHGMVVRRENLDILHERGQPV